MKTFSLHNIRNVFVFSILFLALNAVVFAQTPQYYNYNNGTSYNSFPFNIAAGKMIQGLVAPGEFNQPGIAPSGYITKFYTRISTGYPLSSTYTTFKIIFYQAAITALPPNFYNVGGDTVYQRASVTLTGAASTWLEFVLDHPYVYDNTKSLIFQIEQCASTQGTGFSLQHSTTATMRRSYSVGGCPFAYAGQSLYVPNCGISVAPMPPRINMALTLPSPGVNTNYVTIPYNATMSGIANITIEAWVKIGSLSTANTILHKGGTSFDYQFGTQATSGLLYFRAQGITTTSVTSPVTAGAWTHVAVTYDGSNVVFYKNGVPESFSVVSPLGTSTNEMRIGRGNTDPFSGKIDELRLWSDAKTPGEILANACLKWIPNNATGLRGKWHLDSTLVDSVNNWNGTAMGNVSFDTAMNCVVTDIKNVKTEIPKDFQLYQNYPNPFNPVTTIKFSIPKNEYVEMKIYDIAGKELATLVSDPYLAGTYQVDFNASKLSSGIYFYRIIAGDFSMTKKMILIK